VAPRVAVVPILALALLQVAVRPASAFNIYLAGTPVTGREYNQILDRWIDRELSLWVGAEASGTEHLLFKVESSISPATAIVPYTQETRQRLEQLVGKAIEWSDVARANEADTTQPLGCFGPDPEGDCEEHGTAVDEGQVGLQFFAANGGTQTDLILSIVDHENPLIEATLYLEPPAMKSLLEAIRGIDTAIEQARDTAEKQRLFK
jgi:hypothetical protein